MKITRRGRQVSFIDTEAINLDGHDAFRDVLDREFHIDPYKTLSNTTSSLWGRIFRPVNGFLASLSVEDQIRVGRFYICLRRKLRHTAGVSDAGCVVADAFQRLVVEMDLITRIIHTIKYESDLTLPGCVVFDVNRLELDRDAYTKFVAIGYLCKFLFPIWGEMLSQYDVGFDDREAMCVCLNTLDFLRTETDVLAPVFDRIRTFITTSVEATTHEMVQTLPLSLEHLSRHVESHLIVGLYPEIIQDTPAGSLWLMSNVKSSIDTLLSHHIVNQTRQT